MNQNDEMRESRLIGVVKERKNRKKEREIEWERQKQRKGEVGK